MCDLGFVFGIGVFKTEFVQKEFNSKFRIRALKVHNKKP